MRLQTISSICALYPSSVIRKMNMEDKKPVVELNEKRDLLIGNIIWWAHLELAVTVATGAASGTANPYHHGFVCGEEKGWLTLVGTNLQ